ncbi:sensor histidine kinase [Vagococcus entomophilus]|uniref:histidine kinase n=1 Tax=Vagococcus entomophilus TaxID=1160095 RepID=A0A430AIQ4_9ENTE|nr:HAMP domain-containing sensor histidine kinase [Vagococcus entomophilus]RSU07980.1 two-component sensor histidine kinase [Vagococcus entomophilus]
MQNLMDKKQYRRFFLINLGSFALIFIVLGLIVFQILERSLYASIDGNLSSLSTNQQYLQNELLRTNSLEKVPSGLQIGGLRVAGKPLPTNFQTQTLIWSSSGEIKNKARLGERYDSFSKLKLRKKKLNQIVDVTTKDLNGNTLSFRSITVQLEEDDEEGNPLYVQILYNTNATRETVNQFKNVLIICMVIFWFISIALSYYLSRINMKPVLHSWKKQQEFVENASHELRTPLTIIQSKLENMFVHPSHTVLEESESIALALGEVRRLNQLTRDLLLLARSDSNMAVVKKEPVNVSEFMKQVIDPYKEIAETQNKTLYATEDATKQVVFDPKRIHQLLVILIDNALKFTQEGDEIEVFSTIKNQQWILEVRDSGRGIPDKEKKHVFDRFYREDSARQRETGGYGLGLAIAMWIVKNHNGKITIRDNQPKGTVFHVEIPF